MTQALPINGRHIFHLAPLRLAARIFPLDFYIRNQSALQLIQMIKLVQPQYVAAEINQALKNDPFAFDLIYDRDVLEKAMKDDAVENRR